MSRAGRSLSLALVAFAVALPGAAAGPSTPASIAAAMQGSKITYSMVEPGAVKNPVKELDCPPRQTNMRVVDRPDGRSLVPWQPSQEAAPHFAAAETHFAAREYAAAEEEYERGLAFDPSYGPGWLYDGDIPFARRDFAKALDRYRKALALDPTLAQAHRFAGDALFKLGRLGEAEDEYVEALVDDPSYDGPLEALELLGARVGFKVFRPEFLARRRSQEGYGDAARPTSQGGCRRWAAQRLRELRHLRPPLSGGRRAPPGRGPRRNRALRPPLRRRASRESPRSTLAQLPRSRPWKLG